MKGTRDGRARSVEGPGTLWTFDPSARYESRQTCRKSEGFPPDTLYGSAFFTLVGLHAFHVLTGVIALSVVRRLGKGGRFGSDSYWGVEGVLKCWHFVDVAWVFIFPTLYLVS